MYYDTIKNFSDKLENKGLLTRVENETDKIQLIHWLNLLAKSELTNIRELSFDAAIKNGDTFLLFKFVDETNHICKGGILVEGSIIDTLDKLVSYIVNGEKGIEAINSKLDEIRTENGIILNVEYRWGFSKSTQIAYWDYSNIAVRLGKESIDTICKYLDSNEFEQVLESMSEIKWSESIPEFIEKYNSYTFNKKIKSKLDYDDTVEALTANMLTQKDIVGIIENNREKTGIQRLKSVYAVTELGKFIAIVLWTIDYEVKDISVDILDDKVIDIENNRFVSDHSLYSRIEHKILSEVSTISEKFSSKAS